MEQRHNKIKVASAILFLFISPSWSYIIPVNSHPAARVNVRRQHLLEYPNSRRFVLTQNLQHDQYLGFSPNLRNQRGYIPYYTTNGQVVLNEVQQPVAPPALPAAPPALPEAPAAPAALPVAPIAPIHPIVPIVTEAPTTLPPTTTAAPTTTPAPATTTAPPPPPPPETPAPEIPAPAPPAPEIPVAVPAPVAVAPAPVAAAPAPQIVQIQPSAGFPQGIIAVQPIITHGGFLNLGSSSQPSFPAQGLANNLFSGPALNFLQALLAQQLPAAAPAVIAPAPEPVIPVVTEAPTTAAPATTTPAPTTTAAPETPAPTTTVAPAPVPAHPVPEVMMVILPPAEVAHPAPEVPATEAPATEAPAPAPEAEQPANIAPPAQTFPQGLYYGELQGWNFGAPLNAEQLSVSDPSKFIINVPDHNLNAENLPKPQQFEGLNTEVTHGAVNGDFNVVVNHNSGADSSGTSFTRFKSLHINGAQPNIETEQQKIVHTNTYEYGQQIQHEQSLPLAALAENKETIEAYQKSLEESSGRGWQPLVESHSVGNGGAHFDFGYAANNHFVRQGRKYRRRSN